MFSSMPLRSSGKITKAVIPVAGLETQMLPVTKATPKEMLPLVDKPLIQYVVDECASAGIKEIIFVTDSSKNSIENHFDTSFELEVTLEKELEKHLLDKVQSVCPPHVSISSIRQNAPKGLGHAILCAYPLVGNEPFVVVLPDVIIDDHYCDMTKDNLAAMMAHYQHTRRSQVLVKNIPKEHVSFYGIVDCQGKELNSGQSLLMSSAIEKPRMEEAPSTYSIVGRYVFSEKIWSLLQKIPSKFGGMIELTDAIDMLIRYEPVEAYCLIGKSHDCGNKRGYIEAFIEYARRQFLDITT